MSWGDWKRKLGINKAGQRARRELSRTGQRLLGDDLYRQVQRVGSEATETYQDVTEQTQEFVDNPLEWATRTLMPDVVGDVTDWARYEANALIGHNQDAPKAVPVSADPNSMPDLAAARARLAARKPRFGRAASILSDRPATSLGYTGSANIANVSLGA